MLKPFSEIMAGLAAPLPPECISHRKAEDRKGGKGLRDIRFVHYVLIMDVLDQVAGTGNWCGEQVEMYEVRDQLFSKVKLTIRAIEGDFTQYGIGWSTKEGDLFGGPVADAYATAFRRAAMQFGFERRLWDDDEQHLAKLRAHWAKEREPVPEPVNRIPPGTPEHQPKRWPGGQPPEEAPLDWTICYNDLLDVCTRAAFDPVRVINWLRKTYGRQQKNWTERDMPPRELQDAAHRIEKEELSMALRSYLRGEPPADPSPDGRPGGRPPSPRQRAFLRSLLERQGLPLAQIDAELAALTTSREASLRINALREALRVPSLQEAAPVAAGGNA